MQFFRLRHIDGKTHFNPKERNTSKFYLYVKSDRNKQNSMSYNITLIT